MITKRGYKIDKASLSSGQIEEIRKDLLVRPASASHHAPPPAFSVLKESTSSLYLPRCYAYDKFGKPDAPAKFPPHLSAPGLKFTGVPRPVQKQAIDAYMDEALNRSGAGTIVLQCGGGKTVIGCIVMCLLGGKTLVVAHKDFLCSQWAERIAHFVPTAKIGIMKGAKYVHEDCDVVIASLQTLISRKYPLDGFMTSIWDECHHASARVFVTSLMAETTKYMLGLTATPARKDGLGRVFLWFLGSIVFKPPEGDQKRSDVVIQTPRLPQRDEGRYDFSGRPDVVSMVTDLTDNVERTRDIADMALKVLKDPQRCLLILSERRKHLTSLYELLEPHHGSEMGYYVGGMKPEEREVVEQQARLILASFSAASEGFDCSRLNSLILASPKSDVVQSIGRIMRTQPGVGPVAPLIIDPQDPLFAGPAKKRMALYKKRAYKIENPPKDDSDEDAPLKQAVAFRNIKLQ
jgi:superfamily II DNA or RNA helicase